MITILGVNKSGNKIIDYDCTDGSNTLKLTKDKLAELIQNKEVSNAKMQVYKGTVIIRVKDSVKTINQVIVQNTQIKEESDMKKEITQKEMKHAVTTMEELFGKFDSIDELFGKNII